MFGAHMLCTTQAICVTHHERCEEEKKSPSAIQIRSDIVRVRSVTNSLLKWQYVKVSQHTHARAYKCVLRHRLIIVVYGTIQMWIWLYYVGYIYGECTKVHVPTCTDLTVEWTRQSSSPPLAIQATFGSCVCVSARERSALCMNEHFYIFRYVHRVYNAMCYSGHQNSAHRATQRLTGSAFLLCTAGRTRLSYFLYKF